MRISDVYKFGLARVGKDASGNATALVGLDSSSLSLVQRRLRTALVCGDSITAFSEVSLGLQTVHDNGDGTATAYKSGGHGLGVGQPFRIFAGATSNVNVMDGVVLACVAPDPTKYFTFSTGGRTHNVVSAGSETVASVVYPTRRGTQGWFTQMEIALGEQFQSTWCAVPGASAADISALLNVTPTSAGADVGFLCIGMNNVYKLGQSFATAQAEIKALIDKMRPKCGLMVILSIPPKSASDTANGWTAPRQIVHNKLNRWLYDYSKTVGAIHVQTARTTHNGVTYVNQASTYAEAEPTFLRDGTHSSARGAMAVGRAVADVLAPFMGTSGWKPAHPSLIGSDTNNLLSGSDFPTASGGLATGWTMDTVAGLSVTPTLEARTVATDGDACGNNQRLDIAYGTATGTGLTAPNPRFRKNGIHGLVTAGQVVQFRIPFSVTGATGLLALDASLFGTLPSSLSWQVSAAAADSNLKPPVGSFSGVLITPPAVVPAGLTNLDIWVRPTIDSTQTGPVTIKLWQPELLVVG